MAMHEVLSWPTLYLLEGVLSKAGRYSPEVVLGQVCGASDAARQHPSAKG